MYTKTTWETVVTSQRLSDTDVLNIKRIIMHHTSVCLIATATDASIKATDIINVYVRQSIMAAVGHGRIAAYPAL